MEYDPRLWNADPARTVVHIDSLPAQIDNHYQPALELRGDVAATVRALAGQLSDFDLTAEFAAEPKTAATAAMPSTSPSTMAKPPSAPPANSI